MMNPEQRSYNPFGNMNNRNRTPKNTHPGVDYKSWKNKDAASEKPKEVNLASFTEFPDLIQPAEKKSVFEGTSLAAKLKETIAAEEEAAILKRLKKGDTPEMILREGCVSLPLKNYKQGTPLTVPDWVTDASPISTMPVFKHKTPEELLQERKWKRLGINPNHLMFYDEPEDDGGYQEDKVSLPSDDNYDDYEQEDLVLDEHQ